MPELNLFYAYMSKLPLIALLVILKTILDVKLHQRERKPRKD